MAIIIDDRAFAAVARRRTRTGDAGILLRIVVVPVRGMHRLLAVSWAPRDRCPGTLAVVRVRDVEVYIDERIARYTRWHDVTISAWHFGPIDRLLVVEAALDLLRIGKWEQTHPGCGHQQEAGR